MLAPSSRLSKSARTGTRVPLKTYAPLTLPGRRSTSGQYDQSSTAIPLSRTALGPGSPAQAAALHIADEGPGASADHAYRPSPACHGRDGHQSTFTKAQVPFRMSCSALASASRERLSLCSSLEATAAAAAPTASPRPNPRRFARKTPGDRTTPEDRGQPPPDDSPQPCP